MMRAPFFARTWKSVKGCRKWAASAFCQSGYSGVIRQNGGSQRALVCILCMAMFLLEAAYGGCLLSRLLVERTAHKSLSLNAIADQIAAGTHHAMFPSIGSYSHMVMVSNVVAMHGDP